MKVKVEWVTNYIVIINASSIGHNKKLQEPATDLVLQHPWLNEVSTTWFCIDCVLNLIVQCQSSVLTDTFEIENGSANGSTALKYKFIVLEKYTGQVIGSAIVLEDRSRISCSLY